MRHAILALALLSCGDPLVDGRYLGEPLYRVTGWVHLELPTEALDSASDTSTAGALRVAVFWAPAKGESIRLDGAVEQAVATTGLFPAKFEVTLYEPPDRALYREVDDGEGEVALALLLAYLDVDGDGRWDRDSERLVGGAHERLLAYTPTGFSSPTLGRLGPGFGRLVATNSDCSKGPIQFVTDVAESVDLIVGLDFPTEILLDANCDGGPTQWTGLCPPLAKVRSVCRESGSPDPFMCPTCEGLLWPVGADRETCEMWLQRCLYGAPAHECEGEYRACVGLGPPPDPTCDLMCVCERILRDCYAANDNNPACKDRYYECTGTSP
jgi:hypothetical protein